MSIRLPAPFPNRSAWRASFVATLTISACSLQSFDYLQEGASSATGGKTGLGGATASSGQSNTSGGKASSNGGSNQAGGKVGAAGNAGSGGSEAGDAGAGGAAGAEAGAGGDAGANAHGGTGSGGTGASSGGTLGESAGAAGAPSLEGNLLENPSFEASDHLSGWIVDPASAIKSRYVYTQTATGGSVVVDGSWELATWHATDEYSVTISQVVTRLRPGKYSLKANFASDKSQGAYLFARNCGGTEQDVVIPTVTWEWTEIGISEIEVTGTSCEIGFSVHGIANDWMNADMFTFEKVP